MFRITDVAGQRQWRKVWLELMQQCAVLIFLVSLSDYDETLQEIGCEGENCLSESIALFRVRVSFMGLKR